MWISQQNRKTAAGDRVPAEVGAATLAGNPATVYLNGERRQVPLFAPGGYHWRPAAGDELLVIKTGAEGELPCAVGQRVEEPPVALESGEVALTSGSTQLVLHKDGRMRLQGDVEVQGDLTVNGDTIESMIIRILGSMMG